MKKLINMAFGYGLAGLAGGVFYREFTKFNDFTGTTALGKLHVHFLVLGTLLCMVLALFALQSDLAEQKTFGRFQAIYNVALPFMVVMLLIRGITQVLGMELSRGMNAAISGLAGIAHILLTIAFVYLYRSFRTMKAK